MQMEGCGINRHFYREKEGRLKERKKEREGKKIAILYYVHDATEAIECRDRISFLTNSFTPKMC